MRILLAAAATLLATPVLAQATPPAPTGPSTSPATSPSGPGTSTNEAAGSGASTRDAGGGRHGRGPVIRMQGPSGSKVTVRCAEGETTRACADVVIQLIERTRSHGGGEHRRDWDRGGDMRGDLRGGGRGGRDRDRDDDRDF